MKQRDRYYNSEVNLYFIIFRPSAKIDGETINKLSYQPWVPGPKMDLPWARKAQYKPPTAKMCDDTIYHKSYPAPGYYIEDCNPAECPCPPELQENCGPNSLLSPHQ